MSAVSDVRGWCVVGESSGWAMHMIGKYVMYASSQCCERTVYGERLVPCEDSVMCERMSCDVRAVCIM